MSKLKKIMILGIGGTSIDIFDTLEDINGAGRSRYKITGFLDDNKAVHGKVIHGVKVLGPLAKAREYRDCCFVCGITSPSLFFKRAAIIERAGVPLERFETICHPSTVVSRWATLGRGTVLLQNVTVNANARIGDHVIVLPNTVISHDDVIGDYTSIASAVSLSGGVKVGRSCYLGANCSVKEYLTIGSKSLVGLGSVVLRDVPANSVVVGNPAKFLRKTPSG